MGVLVVEVVADVIVLLGVEGAVRVDIGFVFVVFRLVVLDTVVVDVSTLLE